MRRRLNRPGWWRLGAAAGGTVLFLEGCDPTLRATVEDGIINTSTSFMAAFMRALIEVGQEAQSGATAQVLTDVVERVLA